MTFLFLKYPDWKIHGFEGPKTIAMNWSKTNLSKAAVILCCKNKTIKLACGISVIPSGLPHINAQRMSCTDWHTTSKKPASAFVQHETTLCDTYQSFHYPTTFDVSFLFQWGSFQRKILKLLKITFKMHMFMISVTCWFPSWRSTFRTDQAFQGAPPTPSFPKAPGPLSRATEDFPEKRRDSYSVDHCGNGPTLGFQKNPKEKNGPSNHASFEASGYIG